MTVLSVVVKTNEIQSKLRALLIRPTLAKAKKKYFITIKIYAICEVV